MLLFLGLIYGWSVFVTPLETEFSWVRSQTSLVFTFSMSSFCIGGFISGLILKRRSAQFVLRMSAVCMLSGFFLSSRVSSLWGIYLSYGVLCGLGVGFGYNAIVGTVAKWFPEKPGLCSGLLLSGYGLGGLLLGTGAAVLISAYGWRTTFLLFCVLFSSVLVVGSLLLRPPTSEEEQTLPKRQLSESDEKGMTPREAARRPSFWLLFFWALLLVAVGFSVIGQAVPFAAEAGATAAVATLASGLISVCNGLSRLLFGSLFDKLGRKKTMLLDTAVLAASIPVLYAASRFSSVPLVIAGFLLLGTGYGGVPALVASSTNHMYGVKYYALNYGAITLHILPAALLGPILSGNIRMIYGSYAPLFPILLILCVPAAVLAASIKKA
jgi:OFA family oxalate/formate antiporter-like MFS transporter